MFEHEDSDCAVPTEPAVDWSCVHVMNLLQHLTACLDQQERAPAAVAREEASLVPERFRQLATVREAVAAQEAVLTGMAAPIDGDARCFAMQVDGVCVETRGARNSNNKSILKSRSATNGWFIGSMRSICAAGGE